MMDTKLTKDEALVLSRELSIEAAKRNHLRKQAQAKGWGGPLRKPYPAYPKTVQMSNRHYLSYTWDHFALLKANARCVQWEQNTPEMFRTSGTYILGLKIKPCRYCGNRDMDGHEIPKQIAFNCTCDGSGCPDCKRWGMFSCKYCFDAGEIWVFADGREVQVTDLPGYISGVGDPTTRTLDFNPFS